MQERARLVVANGDPVLARTLGWILAENGYEVTAVADAVAAWEAVHAAPPDLLLLEHELAGGGARAVLGRLRHDPRLARLPAVVIAGASLADPEALDALGVPHAQVVLTPFRVRDLLDVLRRTLRATREGVADLLEERARREEQELIDQLAACRSAADCYQLLVRGTARHLRLPSCSVVLARRGDATGRVVAASDNPLLRDFTIRLERYPEIVEALETGQPCVVYDVPTDPRFAATRALWQREGLVVRTRSAAAFHLRADGTALGLFLLRTMSDDTPLASRDVAWAERAVGAAAAALGRLAAAAAGEA